MNIIKKAEAMVSNQQIKEASQNIIEDACGALLGDPISISKILIAVAQCPFFLREQLFWINLQQFINGVYIHDSDIDQLKKELTCHDTSVEYARRLLNCIDKAETESKVQFLIHATRSLILDFIDRETFFRICHCITNSVEEDLLFVMANVKKQSKFQYNMNVQGLITMGLMHNSVIDGKGVNLYTFTQLALYLDEYSLSYSNTERYPETSYMNANQEMKLSTEIKNVESPLVFS